MIVKICSLLLCDLWRGEESLMRFLHVLEGRKHSNSPYALLSFRYSFSPSTDLFPFSCLTSLLLSYLLFPAFNCTVWLSRWLDNEPTKAADVQLWFLTLEISQYWSLGSLSFVSLKFHKATSQLSAVNPWHRLRQTRHPSQAITVSHSACQAVFLSLTFTNLKQNYSVVACGYKNKAKGCWKKNAKKERF